MPPEAIREEPEYEFDPGLWEKVLTYRGRARWVAVSETAVVASGDDAREVLRDGAKHTPNPALIRVPERETRSFIL